MKQDVKSKKNKSDSIKRMVSDRFFKMVTEAIDKDIVKNHRDFALRINEDQAEFSKIKNPSGTRYVDIEMLWKAVNVLGINANHILVESGLETEKLQRENVTINGGSIHGGQNNVVLNGQAVANNGDVYFKVEKIANRMSAKDRKDLLKNFDSLQKQNTVISEQNNEMAKEIEDLKKTIDRYEREIAKDKKIIETQEKVIKLMETDKNPKS